MYELSTVQRRVVELEESRPKVTPTYSLDRDAWEEAAEEALARYRDHLEHAVKERTAELERLTDKLQQELADRKRADEMLDAKSASLEELNGALKVLLRQREKEKRDLEERFMTNVKDLVLPYVEKVRMGHLDAKQSHCLDIVETNLNEIVSPLAQTAKQFNLSPREKQILSLIKQGKKTKEIAEIMGVAPSSIDTHRNNIRTKLKLSNKKINLQSFLQSI